MDKLVSDLNAKSYRDVHDILSELLRDTFEIIPYSFLSLKSEIEYVLIEEGSKDLTIVKLGEKENTLKHQKYDIGRREVTWGEDVKVTKTLYDAYYYRLDKLDALCANHLSGRLSETYRYNQMVREYRKR